MNEVINEMSKKSKEPDPQKILMYFNTLREHYDLIIIVEGSSDEDFYKNTNIDILNNNKAFYIFASRRKDDINNKDCAFGKEAVIESYFEIREQAGKRI